MNQTYKISETEIRRIVARFPQTTQLMQELFPEAITRSIGQFFMRDGHKYVLASVGDNGEVNLVDVENGHRSHGNYVKVTDIFHILPSEWEQLTNGREFTEIS